MTEYPDGLPVGAGWVSTVDVEEIVFPFDGSVVGTAPVGTPSLARRAVDERGDPARRMARPQPRCKSGPGRLPTVHEEVDEAEHREDDDREDHGPFHDPREDDGDHGQEL